MRYVLVALSLLAWPSAAPAQYQIKDDATGGDCRRLNLGTWNRAAKTCTLTRNINGGSFVIRDDKIVLDGNGRTVTGNAANRIGVNVTARKQVEVKNLRLSNFNSGILIKGGRRNEVAGNTVTGVPPGGSCGICLDGTSNSWVSFNTVVDNDEKGIEVVGGSGNFVEDNTIRRNRFAGIYVVSNANFFLNNKISGTPRKWGFGIKIRGSWSNVIESNEIKDHPRGPGIWAWQSSRTQIKYNTLSNNSMGVGFHWADDNRVFCNDFTRHGARAVDMVMGAARNVVVLNNFYGTDSASDAVGPPNAFSEPRPTGGNHWQVHACVDANNDNFCDAPYVFAGNQDKLPHKRPVPWRVQLNLCESAGDRRIALVELFDEWESAMHDEDFAALSRALAEGAVVQPPDGPSLRSLGPISGFFELEFARMEGFGATFVDVAIEGNSGFGRGTLTIQDQEGLEESYGFVLVATESVGEAVWHITRLMWYRLE